MNGLMKKCVLLAAVFCLFLTGCGEELWTMTPEEEELIVAYASSAVAKNNRYLAQGLTYYEEEEVVEPEPQVPAAEEPDPVSEGEQPGSADPADLTDPAVTPEETGGQQSTTVTLTEALGLLPVTAQYQGYQTTDNYVEGSYFALHAEPGNQYIILNIDLTNPTQEAVECNNLVRDIRCTLVVNGEPQAQAEPTILLNDLATYIDTLDPGVVQDTILIFEVPQDVAGNVQSLAMEIDVEGTLYHVDLQ